MNWIEARERNSRSSLDRMAKLRKKIRILVAEDESIVAMDIQKTLQNLGYDAPYVVSTANAAIQKAKEDKPDLVLMDIMLKGKVDGVKAAEQIRTQFNIPVVYLTAYADEKTLKRATVTEPFGYVIKPFDYKDLRTVIEIALYKAKAESELRASKASFHNIVEKSVDGVVIVDRGGIVQFVNQAAEALFGRKAEELLGELFGLPVMGDEVIELDVVRHGREPGIAEMRVAETEWNGQGAYLALLRDITDRKLAEEKIKRAAQEWRTTFDSITDMISIHDKNFKILRVNQALAKAFKIEPRELIGKTCYEVFHNTKQPCPNCPHSWSLRTNKPAKLELFEPHLGIHLGISTSPVFDDKGEVIGSVHIAKDITERKQAEETLKKANEKLTEYNQLKDEFVSTASHELRTPLSIIQGAIRLILDEIPGKIVEEQRKVLATAMENVKRLGRIVDSLLNISRIESGKLDLQKTVVNICKLIEDTVSDYKALAEEKDICLDYEVPQRSVNIGLDPDKTKEVLMNLISNSLKFTPEKGWVKVVCAERDGEVLVSVQDSGVGIAKQDIPKLFDKFTQFGRKAGPGEKGTGLGLAIAKKLVEMHGGNIEVESEVGRGTTFTISLPLVTKSIEDGLLVNTDELVENTLADN